MRLLVGTSGWSYAPWKGIFYPERLPASRMLSYYAERLPAVEINNTFYRMPKGEVLTKWGAETGEAFCFALKAPRRITHERRLNDVEDATRRFFETAGVLGAKLGPTLFQLPPFLRKDLPLLEAFLETLTAVAPAARPAFEFRHVSWFADDVFAALKRRGAALCVSESEELVTPLEATAPWGYLRLRRQDYLEPELAVWAERLGRQPWGDTFVFFKHEDAGRGPALAQRLAELMGQPTVAPPASAQPAPEPLS